MFSYLAYDQSFKNLKFVTVTCFLSTAYRYGPRDDVVSFLKINTFTSFTTSSSDSSNALPSWEHATILLNLVMSFGN